MADFPGFHDRDDREDFYDDPGILPEDQSSERPEDISLLNEEVHRDDSESPDQTATADLSGEHRDGNEGTESCRDDKRAHFLERAGQLTDGLDQLQRELDNNPAGDEHDDAVDSIEQLRQEMDFLGRQIDPLMSHVSSDSAAKPPRAQQAGRPRRMTHSQPIRHWARSWKGSPGR